MIVLPRFSCAFVVIFVYFVDKPPYLLVVMPDTDPVPLTGDTVVPVVEGGAARSSESADEPVQHVSVKPPAFMESAVQGWFAIMQAQFHLSKITNNTTRFYHVLAGGQDMVHGGQWPPCLPPLFPSWKQRRCLPTTTRP